MEVLGLIDIPGWLLFLIVFFAVAYIYGTWTFSAFDGYGLPGPKPYPFIGTMGPSFKKGLDYDVEVFKKYGKTVALFLGRQPAISTADEEIIKAVTVKEFQHFQERFGFDNGNEVTSDMLSVVSGERWRRLRHLMSPTFSTGKLRKMNYQVNHCTKLLVDNLGEYAKSGKSCEIKSVMQAYTMDTIAATAFGLEVDSQKNPNDPFVKYGRKAFQLSLFTPALFVAFFCPFLFPVLKWLNIKLFPKDVTHFFTEVIDKAIKGRKSEDSKQVDFLQLMLNAHEEQDAENDVTDPVINSGVQNVKTDYKGMSRDEIVAQGILFFIAGFETTAATLHYLCYSLATNPSVQEKLYEEVKKHAGDKESLDYNLVSEMKYLDHCVNETLRLYPPGFIINRKCTSDVTIKGIHIKKDMVVQFPVFAMQRDPEIFEDPDAFKPERFDDTSKFGNNFIPFGLGPRNCIGMRLALMEVKIAIAQVIRQYKLVKTPDTLYPMKFHPRQFLTPLKPVEIGIERRV